METATVDRTVYTQFGNLLEYPAPGHLERSILLARELKDDRPEAAAHIEAFVDEIGTWPLEKMEEAYTRAFDISPQGVPYLSVILFGEDNYKRAKLMTGLKERYVEHGIDLEGELPDHIGVILRFAGIFSDDEWRELACWCVPGPLKVMIRGLTRAQNPYRHVLEAVRLICAESFPREFEQR